MQIVKILVALAVIGLVAGAGFVYSGEFEAQLRRPPALPEPD